MSGETGIEYLTARWNPVTGCTHVSEGCRNCWAEKQAKRWGQKWGAVRLHPDRLDIPLHWRTPRRVGVCFMGDLFHEDVPDEFIAQVWGRMWTSGPSSWTAENPLRGMCDDGHTFFVLTKRPSRMKRLLSDPGFLELVTRGCGHDVRRVFPLPYIWVGVSVEDQVTADERIPILLDTPNVYRWVSVEPMLGPVDLNKRECLIDKQRFKYTMGNYLDWVVLGGESGPGARPMHPDWARSVRDQCVAAGVPFNFKQWGAWAPHYPGDPWEPSPGTKWDYVAVKSAPFGDAPGCKVWHIGKGRAGHILDGRTWDEVPV